MTGDPSQVEEGTPGLRLREAHRTTGFHIGKKKYEPVSAPERSTSASPRRYWGRFDVPGQTFYTAESAECAFGEVLAPFRRSIDGRDPLAADAEALGIPLEDFLEDVAREWEESSFMGMGVIPKSWREDRQLYTLETRIGGWLVDIEHPDSMGALERECGAELIDLGVATLTVGVLRGDDREVTTLVAERLAARVSVADEAPIGVHFGSKHGYGWCQGYWLRNFPDESLERGALHVERSDSISAWDRPLISVARRFGIRFF